MKKVFQGFMITGFMFCCTGCCSFLSGNDNVLRDGDVEWAFRLEKGTAVITNLTILNYADVSCLRIPSRANKNTPVKKVDVPATAWCTMSVRQIYVEDGIEELSSGLLANNYVVELVSLPESLKSIPDNFAFMARNLRTVEFRGKSSVETIGQHAFYNSGLNHIDIPLGVSSIESGGFAFCPLLTSIKLNQGLRAIGTSVFEGDSKLFSVVIPSGVQSIGDWAFFYPNAQITVPSSVTSVGRHAFGAGAILSFPGNPPNWLTEAWIGDAKIHAICYPKQNKVWVEKVKIFNNICVMKGDL